MSSDIATVTTLKAPLAQTLEFVAYHLHRGVDHMYLFFDDPRDPAFDQLRGEKQLTCVPCDRAHWEALGVPAEAAVQARQQANATAAFNMVSAVNVEWLVHIDVDELLHARGSLSRVFASAPPAADVILFPVKEALPQDWTYERPLREIDLFKYDPVQPWQVNSVERSPLRASWHRLQSHWLYRRRRMARRLACLHPSLLAGYYLGYPFGKAATRTSAPVDAVGNHLPALETGRPLRIHARHGGTVLHFDCMGYAHWKTKWSRRINDPSLFDLDRLRDDRKRILDLFRDATERGEAALRDLYARLYHLPLRERLVLRGLGLVQRIKLNPSWFVASSASRGSHQ